MEVNQKRQQLKQALDFQIQYSQALDGFRNDESQKLLAFQVAEHHLIEKNQEIANLNQKTKIAKLELKSRKQQQIVWAVVFVSSAILIFFWFY